MKICSICKKKKKFEYFTKNRWEKDGLNRRCKKCLKKYRDSPDRIAYQTAYRKSAHALINQRIRRKKNKEKTRCNRFRNAYGIDLSDYNAMLKAQDGFCAICRIHQSNLKKILQVDHCHATGMIRGLLCYQCNMGLGNFKDNKKFLLSAIEYLP